MVRDASLLKTQQYKVRIKGKVEQSGIGVVPFPKPRCSSYWKRSLLVTLNYGSQLILREFILSSCVNIRFVLVGSMKFLEDKKMNIRFSRFHFPNWEIEK